MPLTTAHLEDTFVSKDEGIKTLLKSMLNLNIRNELNEKTIINIINRLLSTAKHRREGLEYLNLVISNCSSTIIIENALNWVNYCLIKFPDDVLRELKLRISGEIIEASHKESDFSKKFVSDYISKVLDNCLTTSQVNLYECKTALKTLTICLKYYPSWFGPHRQKIEKFVLIFLDKDNSQLVQAAALAFHYLQQIGGSGTNGLNHKQNFTNNFHKLCHTVHKLYDTFFENENELFYTETLEEDTFEFQNDPTLSSQSLLHVNAKRIKNVFKFIETMIKTGYPVAKETKPKKLLGIVVRATTMHKCVTGDNVQSLETYQFSLLLLDIQSSALKLLRLFIVWYQTNCLPFSYLISKTIVNSIQRSHNCDCYKYNSLYQEEAYRTLSEWINVSKSSLHPQFQSQLLESILKDITPVQAEVTLTITEAVQGKKSQKAKMKAMTDRIISSGIQSSTEEANTNFEKSTDKSICKFALRALKTLFESTVLRGPKATLINDLYQSIFKSLLNIQSGRLQHPYTDSQCQIMLYEVLVAIFHQNSFPALTSLHTSLGILTRGSNNRNIFISGICNKGLRVLEPLCQPLCPSMCLGREKNDDVSDDPVDDNSTNGSVDNPNSGEYHVQMETEFDISINNEASIAEPTTDDSDEEIEQIVLSESDEFQVDEISGIPVVTTPSEDGGEIVNGQDQISIKEEIDEDEEALNFVDESKINAESLQGNMDAEADGVQIEAIGDNEFGNTVIPVAIMPSQDGSEQEPILIGGEEASVHIVNEPKINSKTDDAKTDGVQIEAKFSQEEDDKDKNTNKRQMSESEEVDCEAKKAKIDEESLNTENPEDDPDAIYLKDDSFVDEVKDYY